MRCAATRKHLDGAGHDPATVDTTRILYPERTSRGRANGMREVWNRMKAHERLVRSHRRRRVGLRFGPTHFDGEQHRLAIERRRNVGERAGQSSADGSNRNDDAERCAQRTEETSTARLVRSVPRASR